LECYQALMGAEQGASFHDLVGKWDSIHCETPEQLTSASLQGLNLAEVDHVSSSIKECLSRAEKIEFRNNPWCAAVGLPLPQFLSEPLASFQARLKHLRSLADEADHTVAPSLPKLSSVPLGTQKAEYAELKGLLESLESSSKPEHRKIWAGASLEKLRMAREEIGGLASYQPLLGERLEPELKLIAEAKTIETVNSSLATLKDYQLISPGWLRIFPTAKVKAAKTLLSSYGMQTSAGDIQKLESFLTRFKARLVVSNFYSQQVEETPSKAPVHDDKLKTLFNSHLSVVDFLLAMQQFQNIAAEVKEQIVNSMAQQASLTTSIALCSQLITRCEKLEALENELIASSIFRSDWILKITAFLREGGKLADLTQEFLTRVDTMEDAIRLRDTIGSMPAGLKLAIEATLTASMDVETAWSLIRKQALSNEISNRIKNEPALQAVDVERLDKAFRQYAEKDALKRELARKNILHHWQYKQVQRLLSASGSQLNSIGAKLKQRFFLRGERALKLRQMINHGRDIPDGDPLFDLCPVWMASPATVAQIFPREAIFDVLIFDEASQCKLEEALPALLRGKRVVIAGDPKQLPPTRFFESAVKQSEDDEIESDQDLFERQQRSVEDLLTAALNLDVQQSYLDVHYRSRNEDLIGFSNQNFYDSRLQPIPGHPSNRATEPPIKFYRVEGVYSDRANQAEADTVLTIVKKLLAMPKPPSIGIACFNLPQRDLILETLDNAAAEDTVFSEQLANARARKGEGSFEGLFVKNLENVQGDERDHMIISTTFAPDESGNFRRNFGPVGTIPGGRRLNVLVTRARSAIHLVTSIPRAEYHVLPEKVEGTPSGRWYLYRYLQYAELLKEKYASPLELKTGRKTVRDAALSESVAQKCQSKHGLQGDVEWGNEGFSVDIALHDPTRPGGVTVGVLCDMNRFAKAPDPVEWESFRTTVLERAGWSFHRVWSPAYFRNPEAQLRAIAKAHAKLSTAQV
ncbi:MAG: AAA domain-containing protein, partial [Verrucomicrobiales bacterium]